jgi:DNA-binding transcriptional MerR regulator
VKEIKPEKYLSADEVSNRLEIQKSTLRKYAGMLDSVDTKQPFFHKDENGIRLYIEEDISWLEQLIRLKNTPGTKLEEAVQSVYGLRYSSVTTADTENYNALEGLSGVISAIQKYSESQMEIIRRQSENIDRLEALVEKLLNEKIEIEQKQLETTKPLEEIPVPLVAKEENQKKGFFQKLFGQK